MFLDVWQASCMCIQSYGLCDFLKYIPPLLYQVICRILNWYLISTAARTWQFIGWWPTHLSEVNLHNYSVKLLLVALLLPLHVLFKLKYFVGGTNLTYHCLLNMYTCTIHMLTRIDRSCDPPTIHDTPAAWESSQIYSYRVKVVYFIRLNASHSHHFTL